MRTTAKSLGLAVILSVPPTTGFGYQEQWQPSTKTLIDYVSEGYQLSQPIVLRLSPFDRTEFLYVLSKDGTVAQCTEIITTRKSVVTDKVLGCADLVKPFQK